MSAKAQDLNLPGLREVAERAMCWDASGDLPGNPYAGAMDAFEEAFSPEVALALLSAAEAAERRYHRRGVKIIELTEHGGAHLCRAEKAEFLLALALACCEDNHELAKGYWVESCRAKDALQASELRAQQAERERDEWRARAEGTAAGRDWHIDNAAELLAALGEAEIQITYLHEKFGETGSGNAVLVRLRSLLGLVEPETK